MLLIAGVYLGYCVILSKNGELTAHFHRNDFQQGAVIPMLLAVGAAWFLAALNE